MDQPTVLIISDDADFSRAIASRWQMERSVPAFTLMGGDLCHSVQGESFELAIVGALRSTPLETVLAALDPATKPVLFVASDSQSVKQVRESHPRVMALQNYEGWLDALVLVCSESLRRLEATTRAKCAEQNSRSQDRGATLGRYMLEMRHTVNNALTSVLGNSELLLADPGTLTAGSRAQIETIRNMALRIHEILQRFSSLEKELSVADRYPEHDAAAKSQAAAN